MSDFVENENEVILAEGEPEEASVETSGVFADDEDREDFLNWIVDEIEQAKVEREEQMRLWRKWRRQREARPERTVKNYPWPKASNIVVPITNITSQGTYGNLKASFTAKDPLWMIKPINKEDEQARKEAEVLTEYFAMLSASPWELNARAKNRDVLYEAATLGTCWVKVIWERRRWRFRKRDPNSGEQVAVEAMLKNGPEIAPLPMEDVLYRNAVQDPQAMPWIAHHFVMPKYAVKDAMVRGDFEYDEDVLKFEERLEDEYKREMKERMGIDELPEDVLSFYEVHFRWAKKDSMELSEECIVTLHVPTRTILQETYSSVGVREFVPVKYMHRPFFLNGIGTAWLSEGMQDEADTLHNMRIDNMHLGMLKMFVAKKTSGLMPSERMWPGRVFLTNHGRDDFEVMNMGAPDMQSERAEFLAKDYAQRATAMNDNALGFADSVAKSGDTFRGQQARMAQSSKMFGSIIEGIEDAYSMIGMFVFMELVNHRDEVIEKELKIRRLSDEKIATLRSALSIPLEDLPQRLQFSVKSTDIDETFDQKKQSLLFQVQLQNMFYDRMLPMAMQMSNPQLPKEARLLAMQVYTASARLLEKVLKFFSEDDTDKYVPAYKKLEMFSELMQQMAELGYEQQVKQILQGVRGGGGNGPGVQAVPRPVGGPQAPGAGGGAGGAAGAPGAGAPAPTA